MGPCQTHRTLQRYGGGRGEQQWEKGAWRQRVSRRGRMQSHDQVASPYVPTSQPHTHPISTPYRKIAYPAPLIPCAYTNNSTLLKQLLPYTENVQDMHMPSTSTPLHHIHSPPLVATSRTSQSQPWRARSCWPPSEGCHSTPPPGVASYPQESRKCDGSALWSTCRRPQHTQTNPSTHHPHVH